jgi:hypothetical protein
MIFGQTLRVGPEGKPAPIHRVVARGHAFPDHALSGNRASPVQLDIIVPIVMSCALLWWVSRGMSWTARLVVTAITLAAIVCIVLFERSGF